MAFCFLCFGLPKGAPVLDEGGGQRNPLAAPAWSASGENCRTASKSGCERPSVASAWVATHAPLRPTAKANSSADVADEFDPVLSACVQLHTNSSAALSAAAPHSAEPAPAPSGHPGSSSTSQPLGAVASAAGTTANPAVISPNSLRPSAGPRPPRRSTAEVASLPLPRPFGTVSAPMPHDDDDDGDEDGDDSNGASGGGGGDGSDGASWVPAPKQPQPQAAMAPLLLVENEAGLNSAMELGDFYESLLLSMQMRLKVDAELSSFRHLPSASSNRFLARLSMGQNAAPLSAAASAAPSGAYAAWPPSGAGIGGVGLPQPPGGGVGPLGLPPGSSALQRCERRYVGSFDWSAPPSGQRPGGTAAADGSGGRGTAGPHLPPHLHPQQPPIYPPYPYPHHPLHAQHALAPYLQAGASGAGGAAAAGAGLGRHPAFRRSNSMSRSNSMTRGRRRTGGGAGPRPAQAAERSYLRSGSGGMAGGGGGGGGAGAGGLGSGPGGGAAATGGGGGGETTHQDHTTAAQLVSDERTESGLWHDLTALPLEQAADVATGATQLVAAVAAPPPPGTGGASAAAAVIGMATYVDASSSAVKSGGSGHVGSAWEGLAELSPLGRPPPAVAAAAAAGLSPRLWPLNWHGQSHPQALLLSPPTSTSPSPCAVAAGGGGGGGGGGDGDGSGGRPPAAAGGSWEPRLPSYRQPHPQPSYLPYNQHLNHLTYLHHNHLYSNCSPPQSQGQVPVQPHVLHLQPSHPHAHLHAYHLRHPYSAGGASAAGGGGVGGAADRIGGGGGRTLRPIPEITSDATAMTTASTNRLPTLREGTRPAVEIRSSSSANGAAAPASASVSASASTEPAPQADQPSSSSSVRPGSGQAPPLSPPPPPPPPPQQQQQQQQQKLTHGVRRRPSSGKLKQLSPAPRSASWYGGAPAVHPDPTRLAAEVPVELRLCHTAAELLEGLSDVRPLAVEAAAGDGDGDTAAGDVGSSRPQPLPAAARLAGRLAGRASVGGWLPETAQRYDGGGPGRGASGAGGRCRSVVLQGRWQGKPVVVKLILGRQVEQRNGALVSALAAAAALHSGLVRVYGIRLLPAPAVGAAECRALAVAASAAGGDAAAAAVVAAGMAPGEGVLAAIMDHCSMGSLEPLTRAVYSPFRPNRSWPAYLARRALLRTAMEVAGGLAHLHRYGLAHGSLRPSNVLLVPALQDRRKFCAKVSDAGLSVSVVQHAPATNPLYSASGAGGAGGIASTALSDGSDAALRLTAAAAAAAAAASPAASATPLPQPLPHPQPHHNPHNQISAPLPSLFTHLAAVPHLGPGPGPGGLPLPLPGLRPTDLLFIAPEALREPGRLLASPAADVYSFGVLLWSLAAAQTSWPPELLLMEQGQAGDGVGGIRPRPVPTWPMGAHPQLRNLYDACVNVVPEQRPSMEQVVLELRQLDEGLRSERPKSRAAAAASYAALAAAGVARRAGPADCFLPGFML